MFVSINIRIMNSFDRADDSASVVQFVVLNEKDILSKILGHFGRCFIESPLILLSIRSIHLTHYVFISSFLPANV
jgi:hypothetical protein